MKSRFALIAALALALSGCSSDQQFEADGSCDGVIVSVNYSGLAENTRQCIEIAGSSEVAKNILASAGVSIEGTKAFGDAVVCRVNNVPSATEPITVDGQDPYLETCEEMPPAFAYWGLWVKNSDAADWEYAMEGVGSLQLTKGQSLGLALSLSGQAPNPDS